MFALIKYVAVLRCASCCRSAGCRSERLQQLLGPDAPLLAHLDEQAEAGAAAAAPDEQQEQPSSSQTPVGKAGVAAGSRLHIKAEPDNAAGSDADVASDIEMSDAHAPAASHGKGSASKQRKQRSQQQPQSATGSKHKLQQREEGDADEEQQQQHGESNRQLELQQEGKQRDQQPMKQERTQPQQQQQAAKQEEQGDEQQQQQPLLDALGPEQLAAERLHTLRSFAVYADWAMRLHFSSQPCNAELKVLIRDGKPGAAGSKQQAADGPPTKRQKTDPKQKQLRQPTPKASDASGGEVDSEDSEQVDADTSEDATEEPLQQPTKQSGKAAAVPVVPERQSSRLQQKGHKHRSGGGTAAKSKAAAAARSKVRSSAAGAGGAAGSAVAAAKRPAAGSAVGAAAGGVAAVAAGSSSQPPVSIPQVEAELWRVVERPDAGRLVEVLHGQDLDGNKHGSGFPLPAWRGLPTDVRRWARLGGNRLQLCPARCACHRAP